MKIQFDGIVTATPDAWLLQFDEKDVWIPRYCCKINEEENTIKMPMGLAIAKKIEQYAID